MPRHTLLLCALTPLMILAAGLPCTAGEDVGAAAGSTELSQLARQFPRHRGPTVLYVNFDGWKNHDGQGHDIQPFHANDGTRGRDIQLILFRAAELFAPFDVQVRRLRGGGKRDERGRGNTTVFVGANTAHVDGKGKKYPYASTPAKYDDFPGEVKGDSHRPNSDPFDFGFVDPVGQGDGQGWNNVWDTAAIARGIAHEAGHTFGLVHVDSKPVSEVMSYDAPNVFFANRSFRITDLNNTGTQVVHDAKYLVPRWGRQRLVTQNSFAYLQAVLGARPPDDHGGLADPGAVDPSFRDGPLVELRPGAAASGAIESRGDYDCFVLRPASAGKLAVNASPAEGSTLAPVLFVFDAAGRNLLAFANGKGRPGGRAEASVDVAAGRACKVVVGAADCATTGNYLVSAGPASSEALAGNRPR